MTDDTGPFAQYTVQYSVFLLLLFLLVYIVLLTYPFPVLYPYFIIVLLHLASFLYLQMVVSSFPDPLTFLQKT